MTFVSVDYSSLIVGCKPEVHNRENEAFLTGRGNENPKRNNDCFPQTKELTRKCKEDKDRFLDYLDSTTQC